MCNYNDWQKLSEKQLFLVLVIYVLTPAQNTAHHCALAYGVDGPTEVDALDHNRRNGFFFVFCCYVIISNEYRVCTLNVSPLTHLSVVCVCVCDCGASVEMTQHWWKCFSFNG